MSQADDTVFAIDVIKLGPWSGRGLSHEVVAEPNGQFWRDVNGGGHFTELYASLKKYTIRVSGEDVAPPALDGISQGSSAVIEAATPVRIYRAASTAADSFTLERTPVSGSLEAFDGEGESITITSSSGADVDLPAHSGAYVQYRPTIDAILTVPPSVGFDEWAAGVPWSAEFAEI